MKIEDLLKEIQELKQRVEKLEGKKRSKAFVRPEFWEVSKYFQDQGSLVCNDEAQAFLDFYDSKNWMVGKNKMKDWKAAVRNWMRGKNGGQGFSRNQTTLSNLNDTNW